MTPTNLPLPGLPQTCDVRFSDALAFLASPGCHVTSLKVCDGFYVVQFFLNNPLQGLNIQAGSGATEGD